MVLAIGLLFLFLPGHAMAMAGLPANLEEDGCLVFIFRAIGLIFIGVYVYFTRFHTP